MADIEVTDEEWNSWCIEQKVQYLEKRNNVTKNSLIGLIDICARTFTPDQLETLDKLCNAANIAEDNITLEIRNMVN